ncbi:MAG: tRNA pseudouridine(38-40) synthase TruA [Verrucomicrobiales bacterium]|nr:tRNA pseudouridine(38-40) synthase TruA [Verrucomicrobiales bacterium]MCP5557299.1 tRNA pseudouridine(38-40) synthase TruA [Verrucomicrobiaceae bacterium]
MKPPVNAAADVDPELIASTTRRLKLTIAYDGTPWRGWQSLPGGRTVQDELNAAFEKVSGRALRVQGSGRTDAGVHAFGQVAHADIPSSARLTDEAWSIALNACLPPSIRVLQAESVPDTFHARFDAIGKTYRYRIWRPRIFTPFENHRAWHLYGPLDEAALARCAELLIGTHNFGRLSANRGDQSEVQRRLDPASTTRTLRSVEIRDLGDVLEIEVEGEGFLYKMVRLIVGTLIHIARGRETTDWLRDLLTNPEGLQSNQAAPAEGLYLVAVQYPEPVVK